VHLEVRSGSIDEIELKASWMSARIVMSRDSPRLPLGTIGMDEKRVILTSEECEELSIGVSKAEHYSQRHHVFHNLKLR
jgi:hypothetical protein